MFILGAANPIANGYLQSKVMLGSAISTLITVSFASLHDPENMLAK